jgi:hypothetical protein
MSQQTIDIGVQGNDGTGDSIRDSFRKVNENFNEIYAVFGAGGTIPFTALSDAPKTYSTGQLLVGGINAATLTPQLYAKTLVGQTGISIDNSDPSTLKIIGQLSNLANDTQPSLGKPLNANNQPLGNIPDPSDALVTQFNSTFAGIASTTIDKLAISKGYADKHYLAAANGQSVNGPIRAREEPVTPDITDADSPLNPSSVQYDTTLTSNFLATEALQRKHVVYRGGDNMTGKLYLSDHPGGAAGLGTPNGADDKQAATKFYVDNKTFVSGINLYVSTSTGDDTQIKTPPGSEGRFWNYAYKTIGAAALQAETLINLSSLEPGPYRQRIVYTISPNQYYSTITGISLSGGNYNVQGYLDAAYLLETNKTFIQSETIAYINNKYVNTFTYDQTKCQRDVNLILNATGTDLVLNTNFNSLQSGTFYFDAQSANVINSQLVQTIDGINQAKAQVLSYAYDPSKLTIYLTNVLKALNYDALFGSNYQSITVARYFTYAKTGVTASEMVAGLNYLYSEINALTVVSANNVVQTLYKNNVNTIITIVQGGSAPTVSLPALNSSNYITPTGVNSASLLLLDNISFFQAEIIAYLGATYPKLSFNATTCKRDVGLIVQAVAYDQMYGGNSRTVYAGQQYWYNSTHQIASTETAATAAAMAYLSTIMQASVQNLAPTQVYQTGVIQYQNLSYTGGSSQVSTIAQLMAIVSGTSVVVTATSSSNSYLTTASTATLNVGMPITFASQTSITLTGFQSIAGAGPYLVTFAIPTQTTAPTTGIVYTVAGNSNSSFNGTFTCQTSTKTSITLLYNANPGSYGSGATTVVPFLGNITSGSTYYITNVVNATLFTISATPSGNNVSLQNAAVLVTGTIQGLVSANNSPVANYPTTANASLTRLTVYNTIGNVYINDAGATQFKTFVDNASSYLGTQYPYINNTNNAITNLTAKFKTVTDVLSGGLGNRPTFTFTIPSSLATNVGNAATLITKNYAFMEAEVLGWVKNLSGSFTYAASNGAQLFAKDMQILLEATAYDMIYGGNNGSYTAASQFWYVNSNNVTVSTIDPTETSVKSQAFAFLQTLIGSVATNQTGASYQQYVTNYVTYSSKTGTGPYLVTLNLTTPTVIPTPVGTLVTIQGQSNTAYNVQTSVVSSTTTSITLSYASDPGVWSTATPSNYVIGQFADSNNYPTTDNVNGSQVNKTVTDLITNLWNMITSVIATNTKVTPVTPDLTNSVYTSSGYVGVRNTIINNSTTIAQAVTTYLNNTYKGGFAYNQATCYRDIGYIVDAMVVDLLTGGTYQSINAGKSYYKNASAKTVAIGTQNIETIDGIVFAEALMQQVLNQVTGNRYQTLVTQTAYNSNKNANSGYVATASYQSITTSNSVTTLTVSGVTGTILPGMVVTGSGFVSSQVVTSVNGTTITLSGANDSSVSGTLTFTLTAYTSFTNNYNTMLNIVRNGVSAAPTPSFGSGVYTLSFANGGNGYVDQGQTGDIKILAGKIIRGITSGVTGTILSYSQGGTNGNDNVTFRQTNTGFFQYLQTTATGTSGNNTITVTSLTNTTIGTGQTSIQVGMGVSGPNASIIPLGVTVTKITGNVVTLSANLLTNLTTATTLTFAEQLEYAESVGQQQITIQVEAGIYYEDYPIRVASNVSIRGDEFRRTIVRPLDRISQSPWRNLFFYRDSVIDGLQIGPINNGTGSTDYSSTVPITSFTSKTAVGDGTYRVTFAIPTIYGTANTSLTYTISGNTNISYNGSFTAYASSSGSITLVYPSDPGTYGTSTITSINNLVSTSLSGSSGAITITLSGNTQASVSWLGYVFQSDALDSYGKPGQAVVNSVSGNFMNCTVIYPFSVPGTITVNSIVGSFTQGETITQASSGAVGTVTSISSGSLSYTPVTGTFVISSSITGSSSGATATVTSVTLASISPGSWHLYTTNNYGRHYLADPTQLESSANTALNNKNIDVFLCNDAVRISNLTAQGHGGFMMVLDPEGQIKSKSPYGQVCSSFSRSINKQTFAGGQFIDGFTGRLFGTISAASVDGLTVTVTGGINSGLDVRAPQAPCAFYVTGNRYQINAITSYSQIFDANSNVIGGTVVFSMATNTPWTAGTGQAINIEMGGNKSMLANDFAQVNDLGYAILATNGGITEQVSTFTYYCYTAFWALNGGQIRSVGSSSAHGVYALRASGYDVTELPNAVNLSNNLAQTARIFNPPTLPQSQVANSFYNNMNTGSTTLYIVGYDYYPTNISELEIDHSLAGKGVVRYQVNSISHTTIYVPTGSVGTGYHVNTVTYTSTSGTTLVVSSTSGIVAGMTVVGSGFTLGQRVVTVLADGISLVLDAAADSTPSASATLTIGDTITVSGSLLGGKDGSFTANTVVGSNVLASVSTLTAVSPSAGLLVLFYSTTGYVSKTLITGTTYNVVFNIPTQAVNPTTGVNYVVYGATSTSYNGSVGVVASTSSTITLQYLTDPGTFSQTTSVVIVPPGFTVSGNSKTGSAPNVLVTLTIPTQTVPPLAGGYYTVAGNSNSLYNGTFIASSTTTTSITLRYVTDPGAYGSGTTTVTFMGSTIRGLNIPFGSTALAVYQNNQIILNNVANATSSSLVYSTNNGNDLTVYITTLINNGVATFTYSGNAVYGGSATYANTLATSSSSTGQYAYFNITVANSQYSAVTLGGQNVLSLNLSTSSGSSGYSSTGLVAPLYDGQLIQIRVLQNFKFYNISNVNPTRPSTAVQFNDNLSSIYRVLSYNLTEATNEILPNHIAVLSTDQSFAYYIFQADTTAISKIDITLSGNTVTGSFTLGSSTITSLSSTAGLTVGQAVTATGYLPSNTYITSINSGASSITINNYATSAGTGITITYGATMGATPGDTRIAVTAFGPQAYIDQVSKGTYAFAWGGRVHTISSYTPPMTTTYYTGYNPSGSSGTTLVVGGTFTGNMSTASPYVISNVSSFTGLVVGEIISGTNIPTGTTIVSTSLILNTITISAAVTNTATGVTITYGGTSGMFAGMSVSGTGFSSSQTIASITNGTTLILSAAPNSTPSGTLVFSYSTTPYITLGSIKYTISGSGNPTTTNFLLQQSRGQIAATYTPSVSFTGNTTNNNANIININSLSSVGVGSTITGTNIPGQVVVTATATTQNVAVMSGSTISSGGVLTVGTVSSGTVAVGMQLTGVGVVQAQSNSISAVSGTGSVATVTLVVPTPTLIATTTGTNLLTLSSTTGIAVNQQIIFTAVSQTTTLTATTNATFNITSSSISGTTLTVGSVSNGTVAIGYQLTGTGVLAGTYITALIAGSGAGSTWLVSQNHVTPTGSISIGGTLNSITVNSTSGMVVGEPVTVGTNVGNLLTSSTYYISEVIDSTHISVASTYGGTTNFTVATTTGQSISLTAGATLGGVTSVSQTYYILSVNTSTNQITVSTSYGGSVQSVTSAGGSWTSVAGTPYVAGSTVSISGISPSGYNNATVTVAASPTPTITQFSYSNTTTGALTATTATYVSGGVSSNIVVVSGVTGIAIAVGMTIIGTGFTSGQTVSSIINSTSFTITGGTNGGFADSTPSGSLTFKQYGFVSSSGPTYITANISGSGGGSTWQTSTNLAVSSTTITGTNNIVTISNPTSGTIVAGNTLILDPTSGSSFGGLSNSSTYYIKQVLSATQIILNAYGSGSSYLYNGYNTPATVVSTATGSITGRTDNLVISTSTGGTFTANTNTNITISLAGTVTVGANGAISGFTSTTVPLPPGTQIVVSSTGSTSYIAAGTYYVASSPAPTATSFSLVTTQGGATPVTTTAGTSDRTFAFGNTFSPAKVLTNVPTSVFTYITVGTSVSGGIGSPIPGSSTVAAYDLGSQTITLNNAATAVQSGWSFTYTANTIVISGPATGTGSSVFLQASTLTTTISVYTNDRTQYITQGMTVFGNGFTSGQTVISATPSTSGAPTTTIVLSAAPNSTPFGVLGFTALTTVAGPYYTTFVIPTQSTAPTVDAYYFVTGNSNSKYNGWVQAVQSTTNSITLAYQTDPEQTVVVTYNPTGSVGTTLKVSSTTGIQAGMVIRGGGSGGFFAGQTVSSVGTDGVTLTISAAPAGTPSGNLTFTLPYGTGTTSFTTNVAGISRPMSNAVSSALQAGYQANSNAQITTRISTCRCSAHDLLDIGTGGYNTTNYPYQIYGNPFIKAAQTQEIKEETVGRVFYVTTDQNGIFRVGRFFTVDQGTGTVTFSASIALSNLNGLGFKRGVVIAEFSTDSTMTNDASDTVPTQSAVRGYIDNRLGVQQSGATTPATALIGNGYMELKGTLPMKGNMSMGGYTIGSLGSPLLTTDASTKGYVDNTIAGFNAISKLTDTAISNPINQSILVYNSLTSKWNNANFSQGVSGSAFSDVLIAYDGTTLTNTIQGSIVTPTYSTYVSSGKQLTVSSTTGIIPGMTITGNGFVSGQTVVSVLNTVIVIISADPDSTPSGKITFTRAGVIINNKVNQYAAVAQSKLAMQIATTNGNTAPTYNPVPAGQFVVGKRYTILSVGSTDFTLIGASANTGGLIFQATGAGTGTGSASELDAIQANNGLSSYNSYIFTVNNGWVTLKDASSTGAVSTTGVDGVAASKLQWIPANSALANITGTAPGAIAVVTTQALVQNGDGIRNQDIPQSTSVTGAIIRTSASPYTYDVTPISTSGSNSSLVKTDGNGNINVKGIQLSSTPSIGNIIDVTSSTTLNFYTPNSSSSQKFLTATYDSGNTRPTVTYYGLNDFASQSGIVLTTDIRSSTGANNVLGKLTGAWQIQSGGSLDLNTNSNVLKVKSIVTDGTDGGGATMQGTYTLTGNSKLQATYADLAEWYTADVEYEPGTVVVFGGEAETTVTKVFGDTRVAGVVTTNPAYVMNDGCKGIRICLALVGRTPVKVLGVIKKGDLLTTASVEGYACKAINPQMGTIIGKALENKDTAGFGVIEVAVGRM